MKINNQTTINNSDRKGQFGSYGNRNLITFQSKIDRRLADEFEIIRRSERKTRKQMLEQFIEWCRFQYLNKKGILTIGEE